MKKYLVVIMVIIIVMLILASIWSVFRKDRKNIDEQQKAISLVQELYQQKKAEGMNFSSQCLGTIKDKTRYAVDIVHVPRSSEDNHAENQCEDYRQGKINHFIELDKDGNIVRIV